MGRDRCVYEIEMEEVTTHFQRLFYMDPRTNESYTSVVVGSVRWV